MNEKEYMSLSYTDKLLYHCKVMYTRKYLNDIESPISFDLTALSTFRVYYAKVLIKDIFHHLLKAIPVINKIYTGRSMLNKLYCANLAGNTL